MRDLGVAALGFLAVQAVLIHFVAGAERPPAPPDLSQFPAQFGNWKVIGEDPIPKDVQAQLQADQILSRTYSQDKTAQSAGVFVAWFQSQSSGARQPHSPQVCLPGSGWIPQVKDDVILNTTAGAIAVNRYVVVNQGNRAVVLYWYQTPRRVIEGEWEAKLWLIPDALRDKRTDTALARIVVWANDGDERATETAKQFGQDLYPVLRERLPR